MKDVKKEKKSLSVFSFVYTFGINYFFMPHYEFVLIFVYPCKNMRQDVCIGKSRSSLMDNTEILLLGREFLDVTGKEFNSPAIKLFGQTAFSIESVNNKHLAFR